MELRPLGTTGLAVSPIGFGAFKIGRNQKTKYAQHYDLPDQDTVDRLLHALLESGITLFDTAPAYGSSEERIGSFLGHSVKRTFGGDGTYLQKRPFLLGLLRVRTWGRYRYMAAGGGAPACTMVAPERVGLRLLGVPLPSWDVRPRSATSRPPVLEAHTWCFADETLCVTRAADGSYGVWLRVG